VVPKKNLFPFVMNFTTPQTPHVFENNRHVRQCPERCPRNAQHLHKELNPQDIHARPMHDRPAVNRASPYDRPSAAMNAIREATRRR
jgi:hypothetical protein